MALIVDEDIARNTPCHGYKNPTTGELYLYSEGCVGMLSDKQEKTYCTDIITKPFIPKRVKEFKAIVDVCKTKVAEYPKGKRFLPYLACMSKEAEKRNFEI